MASHKQAEKRNRQRVKRQGHHRHHRANMRTIVKHVKTAIAEKSKDKAKESLGAAIKVLDTCAQKGVLPRKRASRAISRLTKAVNTLS